MDLSTPFRAAAAAPEADWPVLVAAAVARQAASPTATVQAVLDRPAPAPGRFAPTDGRFSAGAARSLADWKEG